MVCKKCGVIFNVDWRISKKGECKYCSSACSHSRVKSEETRKKVSQSMHAYRQTEPKYCIDCGKKLDWRNKTGICRCCAPSAKTKYEYIKKFRHERKKLLVEYKGGKCQKCGYHKCMAALDFHHRNPKEKEFTISSKKGLFKRTLEEEIKEVDKCDLLCANCHREVHNDLIDAGISPHSDKVLKG